LFSLFGKETIATEFVETATFNAFCYIPYRVAINFTTNKLKRLSRTVAHMMSVCSYDIVSSVLIRVVGQHKINVNVFDSLTSSSGGGGNVPN